MTKIKSLFLILCLLGAFAPSSFALNPDAAYLEQSHKNLVLKSVEAGLPHYNFDYQQDPQGAFKTELKENTFFKVNYRGSSFSPYDKEVEIHIYQVFTEFEGEDGQSGQIECTAFVTQNVDKTLSLKPAVCYIYQWDDEGLRDEL